MKYADYLRITPEVKSAVRVVDDKLCIGGLAYGQDYAVTLLAGLPSASGGKLEDERKVSLALGPRPAAITLPGKGFILPRGTAAGLPITTVNVAKLGISVYRVNERGLEQFTGGRYYYDSSSNFPGTEPVTESWTLRQWLNGENGKRIWRGTMEVQQRPEPGDHHRLPDPRDHQGLEARRLLRRGVELPPSRRAKDDDDTPR